jgi:sulfur carrier protein ThiS
VRVNRTPYFFVVNRDRLDGQSDSVRINGMITVTYQHQTWEIPGPIVVRDLIERMGLSPATVLAVRQGQLVLDSVVLADDEKIRLIAVITGGSGNI